MLTVRLTYSSRKAILGLGFKLTTVTSAANRYPPLTSPAPPPQEATHDNLCVAIAPSNCVHCHLKGDRIHRDPRQAASFPKEQ